LGGAAFSAGIAAGGGAAAPVAVGGAAAGIYASGGAAIGQHVLTATQRDPEAAAFFARYGFRPPPIAPRR